MSDLSGAMDFDSLRKWCIDNAKNQRDVSRFYIGFGKYEGCHVVEVLEEDPQYLRWMFENKKKLKTSLQINKFIKHHIGLINEHILNIEEEEKGLFHKNG